MMTIVASVHNFQIPYGSCTVDEDGCLDEIHEKPSYHHLINTGFYIMNSDVLKNMPSSRKVDMDELIEILQKKEIKGWRLSCSRRKMDRCWAVKEYNSAVLRVERKKHWIMIKI